MSARIIVGDCITVIPSLAACSVDSIVCDPPYGLSFMGKEWDHGVPGEHFWREALRVAKPGAHLLAFGGTRTFHRLMVAIEDAGWEIRDTLGWLYGSGFPKSLDVSKAIDKAAGVDPTGTGEIVRAGCRAARGGAELVGSNSIEAAKWKEVTTPSSDAAKQWQGWGTALKPAWEPIILARKPLTSTVAANVLQHGTGALNIDACRIGGNVDEMRGRSGTAEAGNQILGAGIRNPDGGVWNPSELGRWPANLIHDGSDEVVALFPESDGQQGDVRGTEPSRTGDNGIYGAFGRIGTQTGREGQDSAATRYTERGSTDFAALPGARRGDTGSAARFFYCAKADRADRNEGCEQMPKRALNWSSEEQSPGTFQAEGTDRSAHNHHPTVKPTDLMRYLCRLVTPRGGLILDPFAGSGSTGKAALLEGFRFLGIELSDEYAAIARARIHAAAPLFANVHEATA